MIRRGVPALPPFESVWTALVGGGRAAELCLDEDPPPTRNGSTTTPLVTALPMDDLGTFYTANVKLQPSVKEVDATREASPAAGDRVVPVICTAKRRARATGDTACGQVGDTAWRAVNVADTPALANR
jgi:hypothetical protein